MTFRRMGFDWGFARQIVSLAASNRHARNPQAGIQAMGRSEFPPKDCGNDRPVAASELPGKALDWRLGCAVLLASVVMSASSRSASAVCLGDCNGNTIVQASEITISISRINFCDGDCDQAPCGVAPAQPPACCNADRPLGNGIISAGELSEAIRNVNLGCPPEDTPTPTATVPPTATPTQVPTPTNTEPPTPTPTEPMGEAACGNGVVEPDNPEGPEECDDGGNCIGGPVFCQEGPNLGMPCNPSTSVEDCGVLGGCYGNDCTSDSQCGGGQCRPFGGDDCANNCTFETVRAYQLTGAVCSGGPTPGAPCNNVGVCGTSANPGECGFNGCCLGAGECIGGNRDGADCANGPFVCLGGGARGRVCPSTAPNLIGGSSPCRVCSAGPNLGAPCTSNTQCGAGGVCPSLVCTAGSNRGNSCTTNTQCPGGGACANILVCNTLDPEKQGLPCKADADCGTGGICGVICGSLCAPGGGTCTNKSRAFLQSEALPLPIGPLIASQQVRTGKPNPDGTIPIAIRAGTVKFNPVRVTGLACACVRGAPTPELHGPGNAASGFIGCGAAGLPNIDVTLAVDHNTTPNKQCVISTKTGQPCESSTDCDDLGVCDGSVCTSGPFVGQPCLGEGDCVSAGVCNQQGPGVCSANSPNPGALCVPGNAGASCGAGVCEGIFQGGGICIGGVNLRQRCNSHAECPGSICVSPDDPTCNSQDLPPPAGSGRRSCLEKKEICIGGDNPLAPCTADTQCPGGSCGTINCDAPQASPHAGVCNSPTYLRFSGSGGPGHALLVNTIRIGTIVDGGQCATTSDPGTILGPDGIPCTDDDLPVLQGVGQPLPTTTGTASAILVDSGAFGGGAFINGQCSAANPTGMCQAQSVGLPFNCDALSLDPTGGTSGARLVATFTNLETATVGDNVVSSIQTIR
jgi:hypothetical protein